MLEEKKNNKCARIWIDDETFDTLKREKKKTRYSMVELVAKAVAEMFSMSSVKTTVKLPVMEEQSSKKARPRREKLIKKESTYSAEGTAVIKLFEPVNPSVHLLYGNTNERAACDRLLKRFSYDDLTRMIAVLPAVNADKFAKGKSITPSQFEHNLGFIMMWVKQQKTSLPKVSIVPN